MMPTQIFALSTIIIGRDNYMSERAIRELLLQNGFSVANVSYRLHEKGELLEYRMTVRTMDRDNIEKLSKTFMALTSIVEFNISMAGE
jgi:putative Mg2+ transporter-C (MgtC) family protein